MDYEQSEYAKYDHGPWPDILDEYKGISECFAKGDDFVAVVLEEEKKLIGYISKGKKERKEKEFDFGYVFYSNYHSKGFATESCKAVIEYMFEEIQTEKISTGIAKINKSSYNLLKRLIFISTGYKTYSFRKNDKGNPIVFVGIEHYLLRKNRII